MIKTEGEFTRYFGSNPMPTDQVAKGNPFLPTPNWPVFPERTNGLGLSAPEITATRMVQNVAEPLGLHHDYAPPITPAPVQPPASVQPCVPNGPPPNGVGTGVVVLLVVGLGLILHFEALFIVLLVRR